MRAGVGFILALLSVPTAEAQISTGNAVTLSNDYSRPFPGFLPTAESATPESLPLKWQPGDAAWSVDLEGYGQSAPLIWRNRTYVSSVIGDRKEKYVLRCIDLQIGSTVWDCTFASSFPADSSPMVSRAAPTPICDSNAIYLFVESGDLLAIDFDGKVRWHRSLQKDFGAFENKFGLSSTPVQNDDAIFILMDHKGESSLVAINKSDGNDKWRVNRGLRVHSWSSPAMINVDGTPTLVCSSSGTLDAYDCQDGRLLCTNQEVGGNSVATPYDLGNGRFLVSSLIRPADGPSEGALKSNLLARMHRDGSQFKINIEWIAEDARGSFASPIEHAGNCYWINPLGVLYCLDSKTGKQNYAKRLSCGACWATPLGIGDRIYCFGKEGETVVVRTGDSFEEISTGNRAWVDDLDAESKPETKRAPGVPARPSQYAVVAVDRAFVFRRGDRLVRIDSVKTVVKAK